MDKSTLGGFGRFNDDFGGGFGGRGGRGSARGFGRGADEGMYISCKASKLLNVPWIRNGYEPF